MPVCWSWRNTLRVIEGMLGQVFIAAPHPLAGHHRQRKYCHQLPPICRSPRRCSGAPFCRVSSSTKAILTGGVGRLGCNWCRPTACRRRVCATRDLDAGHSDGRWPYQNVGLTEVVPRGLPSRCTHIRCAPAPPQTAHSNAIAAAQRREHQFPYPRTAQ